jgi:hypothetical protein
LNRSSGYRRYNLPPQFAHPPNRPSDPGFRGPQFIVLIAQTADEAAGLHPDQWLGTQPIHDSRDVQPMYPGELPRPALALRVIPHTVMPRAQRNGPCRCLSAARSRPHNNLARNDVERSSKRCRRRFDSVRMEQGWSAGNHSVTLPDPQAQHFFASGYQKGAGSVTLSRLPGVFSGATGGGTIVIRQPLTRPLTRTLPARIRPSGPMQRVKRRSAFSKLSASVQNRFTTTLKNSTRGA